MVLPRFRYKIINTKIIAVFFLITLIISACSSSVSMETQAKMVRGCEEGNLALVKKALARGAKINEPAFTLLPLYWAASKNQIEVVNFLLNAGANINGLSGPAQRSALHESALKGNFELVKILVEAGADINIRNTHNRTPLYYVTSPPLPLTKPENADIIAKYLIQHGATL